MNYEIEAYAYCESVGSVFFFDRPVLIGQHPGVSLGRKSQKQNHQNRIVSLRDKMAVANPIDLDVDLNQQSVVLEGEEQIRVSTFVDHKNGKYFAGDYFEGVSTMYEAMLSGEKQSENGPCYGVIPEGETDFKWVSYTEAKETAFNFGSGIIEKGFKPGQETYIGIYSQNRPEWCYVDLACSTFSMVSVSLYDSLGVGSSKFIINTAELGVVVCDTLQKVTSILSLKEETPSLKLLVVMQPPSDGQISEAAEKGVELVTFQEIVKLGTENQKELQPPSKDDLYCVCFTSGTTGDPKGVMLTHGNMIANITATYLNVKVGMTMGPSDRYLSYLPLAHMFERCCQAIIIVNGARIGFFRGDIRKVGDDVALLKPTLFVTVPRLLNRIYDKIVVEVEKAKGLKKAIFNYAFKKKKSDVDKGIVKKSTLWDKLVFQKMQARLGGEVRMMLVSSAPMSKDVLAFIRVCFGCWVIEAYGQTESTAAITCTIAGDNTVGHVGPPTANFMIKLVDVTEKDYSAKDGKGEVCCKGPSISKGYLKRPDLTKEAIDEDGWLHTGDIGEWLPNGTLRIIDRKKHIFKLAQGEYLAPEEDRAGLPDKPPDCPDIYLRK
ncbi:putative long-chain-fatty-acid--CoA ligase 1-like [Apostichopus japonicus]|uniref:long-chain-fatty-acid--CoA ligase n=1 Tax=Stichopus japonicus TaxID=307972 RepID=A0A2G8K1Q4_STIJA|nr:putative long-chain-fatty-acid--CoA ligase 1-like [Apostichopus japonicus]